LVRNIRQGPKPARAVVLDPPKTDWHGNLGVVLARQRKIADAEACFRTALALDPIDQLAGALGTTIHDLLPMTPPSDTESVFRGGAQSLSDQPAKRAAGVRLPSSKI
jgi:Tetratricopeptide repeat